MNFNIYKGNIWATKTEDQNHLVKMYQLIKIECESFCVYINPNW
jgi:hypothetical protein